MSVMLKPASIKTLLAFDYGTKRIGVAVGQTITVTARPLATLHANNGEPDWSDIASLIKQWQPDALIVGIPLDLDSAEQKITFLAKDFGEKLHQRFELPVYMVDERYSTIEARQMLFDQGGYKKLKRSEVDSWAAKLILEGWFSQKSEGK
jgi:putative Holliday junction resolvase